MKSLLVLPLLLISWLAHSAELPSGHPSVTEALNADGVAPDESSLPLPYSGRVVDVLQSKNYTYIELATNGATRWLAAPRIELQKGVEARYGRSIPLVNFYSNSLKREFTEIYFVERVQVIE